MNKCDMINIEKCNKIGKICNKVTGRCIKDKTVKYVYKINKYRYRQEPNIDEGFKESYITIKYNKDNDY